MSDLAQTLHGYGHQARILASADLARRPWSYIGSDFVIIAVFVLPYSDCQFVFDPNNPCNIINGDLEDSDGGVNNLYASLTVGTWRLE